MSYLNKQKTLNKILKDNIFMSSLFLLYGVIVSFLFVKWVIPVYGYTGFSLSINNRNIFLSIFYMLNLSVLVNIHKDRVKIILLNLLIIQLIVPMFCLYSFTKEFSGYHNYVLMSVCSFLVISVFSLINIKPQNICFNKSIKKRLTTVIVLVIFVTIFRYISKNGFKIFNLNFLKVYEYRYLLRETMTGAMVYLDGWVFKILNPFCIAISLYLRKKILFLFFFALQVILYGFSSHKSVLFTGIIVVIFYYITPVLLKKKYTFIKIAIYANLSAILLWMLNIKGMFCAIYNRVMFTPARSNFYYYEYFSEHGFDWFRQSFLRSFMDSDFDLIIPRLIGLEYYGNALTNVNTGFLGSGYAQGGFIVILFYSVVIAMIIISISLLSKKLSPRLVLSVTLFPMASLFTSSDLPTSLLTGGILLSLILLYTFSLDKTLHKSVSQNDFLKTSARPRDKYIKDV